MKNRYLTGFLLLISGIFFFPGCYTMVWTPDQNLPDSTQTVDNFYPEIFYGSYGTYYNSPWWNSYSLPSYQTNSPGNNNRDTNQAQSFIRNHEAGRSSPIRDAILNVLAPATIRNGSPATTTTNNNNTSDSGRAAKVENSNNSTNNTSTNNTSTTRGNSSEKNNSVRNNNGSRNPDGRK
ncbi:MAG TPA: hypothetical protein VMV36_01195 [Ignavibacteriaceae bacterium]|nr:hypothetical protein [Ignavibacteriaceae bacterium]